MRCHICDKTLENPTVNKITKKYEPCGDCVKASSHVEFDDVYDFLSEDSGEEFTHLISDK